MTVLDHSTFQRLRRRYLALWLACCLALWGSVASAQETPAAVPTWQVSHHSLGPGEAGTVLNARNLILRLDARPECDAVAVPPTTRRPRVPPPWHATPEGVDVADWLCVATTIFGRRQNWMAFRFSPEDGSVRAAVWRPALASAPDTYSYIHTIPPGPETNYGLVQIELAAAIAPQLIQLREPGPLLQVRVEGAAAAPAELTLDMDAPTDTFVQELTDKQREALACMGLAAAFEAGYSPTLAKAPDALTFKVSRLATGFSMQAVLTVDGKTLKSPVRPVKDDLLYPGMLAMIRWARDWQTRVLDFVHLDVWAIEPLLFYRGTFFYRRAGHADQHTLRAVSLTDMLPAWTQEPGERERPRWTVRAGAGDDPPTIYMYDNIVQPRSLETGAASSTTRLPGPDYPWGFAMIEDDGSAAVVATGNALIRAIHGSREWTLSWGDNVDCGPQIVTRPTPLAVAGGRDGVLRGVALADGAVVWERRFADSLWGPIKPLGEILLVTGERGLLAAVNPANGELAWQVDLGDALQDGPQLVDGHLLAVVGGTRVVKLDPASGKVLAEAQLPRNATYVRGIPALGGRLAVVDQAGTVHFFAATDLKPLASTALHMRPTTGPLFIERAPERWGAAGMLVEENPMLMVPGYDGMCYLMEIPR